jgi:hypothetical protein
MLLRDGFMWHDILTKVLKIGTAILRFLLHNFNGCSVCIIDGRDL